MESPAVYRKADMHRPGIEPGAVAKGLEIVMFSNLSSKLLHTFDIRIVAQAPL